MFGSAALSCAYVASGKCDYYAEKGVYLWDFAAGICLVEEAGGKAEFSLIDDDRYSVKFSNGKLGKVECLSCVNSTEYGYGLGYEATGKSNHECSACKRGMYLDNKTWTKCRACEVGLLKTETSSGASPSTCRRTRRWSTCAST